MSVFKPVEITSNADKIYSLINIFLKGEKLTEANILHIVLQIMKIVDKYPELKGEEKKQIIIDVLKKYVNENAEEERKATLLTLIDLTLPVAIDTFIALDKSEMVIKFKKKVRTCFGCL